MRIIAGEYRSRTIFTPRDDAVTRPIPDRVKQSLFNLLRGHFEGAGVFDGFAGTGAIGLECASRGAARVVCVEQDREIAGLLSRSVASLGCRDRVEVVIGDALGAGALARAPRPLTLAFLDPPYPMVRDALGFARVMAQLEKLVALLTDDGFAVLRTPWPLFHEVGAATAAPEPRRRRKPAKHDWRREARAALEGGPERRPPRPAPGEDDAIDDDAPPEAPADPAARPPRVTPSLRVPGARGPETHVYGSMAVHLYMRQRGGA